jgi:cobalt-zinc-cadmium efflux system outer membrane protein
MSTLLRTVPAAAVVLLATGCASLPPERGYRETSGLVQARVGHAPDTALADGLFSGDEAEWQGPLGPAQAVRLAFARGPRVREEFARLGLGRAGLEEARRLANPSFGFSRLRAEDGGAQITRSLTLGLSGLLLQPSRMRLANAELERLQHAVADALVAYASDVEVAWYEAATAAQVAAMRDLVARTAERSAELAQRFHDAGNIPRLQLEQELAAAAAARIDAVRATAAALQARAELAAATGLPLDGAWSLGEGLPSPPASRPALDALVPRALEQRLDLAAARQQVALREDALGVTRRWRWLGDVSIGYEREREPDGARQQGPTLELELPLFDQGQGELARARAELLDARAALDAKLLEVENGARLGLEQLEVAARIANAYREALLPRREAIVARTRERVDFMLDGVFTLIAARQEQFDAYQEYLEAVRDYWVARSRLRRIVGGDLPGDDDEAAPTLGIDALLPPAETGGHEHHGHHGGAESAPPAEAGPAAGPRAEGDGGHEGHEGHQGHQGHGAHEGHEGREPSKEHDGHKGHRSQDPAAPGTKAGQGDEHDAHRHHPQHDAGGEAAATQHDHGDAP